MIIYMYIYIRVYKICIHSPQTLLIRFSSCHLGVVRNVATLEPFGSKIFEKHFGVENLKIQLFTKIIGIYFDILSTFYQLFLDVKSCF